MRNEIRGKLIILILSIILLLGLYYYVEADKGIREYTATKIKLPTLEERIIKYTTTGVRLNTLAKAESTPSPTYTEDDLYWLAKIVFAEAEDQPDKGQIAVANVVLNRVKSDEFPDTIKKVIFQKTGKIYQFSPVMDGRIKLEPDERAIKNAKLALEGTQIVPEDVLFFYDPNPKLTSRGNWIRRRPIHTTIEDHRFAY